MCHSLNLPFNFQQCSPRRGRRDVEDQLDSLDLNLPEVEVDESEVSNELPRESARRPASLSVSVLHIRIHVM